MKGLLPVAEEPLLNIINSSLSLGHVPKPFKLAVIKPLIKKPKLDPCELANYRPISNLTFMSKILEKVVSAQLCSFLQKNDIYEEFQSGFRPRHSTETALVKITNDLLLASDKGCISLLVLLDLSAAFDTIDHDILIDRLQNYTGIQGQALRWFLPVRSLPLCLFKRGVISIITSKVWSTTRICPRSSIIFIIYVAPW